jgi:hypothetical protein
VCERAVRTMEDEVVGNLRDCSSGRAGSATKGQGRAGGQQGRGRFTRLDAVISGTSQSRANEGQACFFGTPNSTPAQGRPAVIGCRCESVPLCFLISPPPTPSREVC